MKQFLARKMLERQLKNIPEGQRGMFIKMFETDPQLFETIAKEIQEKKKEGQDETLAAMAIMKKYQSEMQALMAKVQSNTK